jgi:hypothetical protein
LYKQSGISEALTPAIIKAMMDTVSKSETLVNFYETRGCNNPEDSHLQAADGA